MTQTLRSLVLEGLDRGRLILPATDEVLELNRMIQVGQGWYSPDASEPVLAAMLTNDAPSVHLILGAIAAGARLVSLPLPGRAADPATYAHFLNDALKATGASRVVARDDVTELLDAVSVPSLAHSKITSSLPLAMSGDSFELIQYTSGSTSRPKPILLSSEVLAGNITAILERAEPCSGDVTVSWLPLSHDMGLIGMLLASLAAAENSWTAGAELVLLEPERFLRRPGLWLEAIDQWRGTFTAAPDFGLRLGMERTPLADLDLGCLRHVIVGGEIVRPATLRSFQEAFEAAGLTEYALAPAYGMAELGLAATMTGPHERWRTTSPPPEDLGEQLVGSTVTEVASSGTPLGGYDVTVGQSPGQIAISTRLVGRDAITNDSMAGTNGELVTGDLGFIEDSQLYVLGRLDDVLVVNGRNVLAPEIEAAVSAVDGVRSGRVTAVGLPTGEWVIVAETEIVEAEAKQLRKAIRRMAVKVTSTAPDMIHLIPGGTLPMTSSGKPQRSEVRRCQLEGEFGPS